MEAAVRAAGDDGAGADGAAGGDVDERDDQADGGGVVEAVAPAGVRGGDRGGGALLFAGEGGYAAADRVCGGAGGAVGVSSGGAVGSDGFKDIDGAEGVDFKIEAGVGDGGGHGDLSCDVEDDVRLELGDES